MDFTFDPEQQALQARVRQLAEGKIEPLSAEANESDEVSWEVVRLIREEGLFRLMVPPEYGGDGVSSVNICIVREQLARVCGQADSIFVMQGLGSYPITRFASEEQKRKYLPPVASGEKLIAFCLTEPGAGSDVGGIQTTATLEGEHYLLNGTKCYVSRPDVTDIFTVFAKTDPTAGARGISAFIVERGGDGFAYQKDRMNVGGSNGRLIFTNLKVPGENLFGEPGRGMRIALGNLDVFRTSVGAASLGMAQRALEEALAHAKRRKAFGMALAEFQAIQFKLADMATLVDAARLLIYRAASLKDQGVETVTREASMAKLFATEAGQKVVDEAVQIHGGLGVTRGTRVEYLYRAIRAPRIYEGTSEIQHIVIARQLLREHG